MDDDKRDRFEKALDPRTRPIQLSLDEARGQISTAIYEATALFEQLEASGRVRGNGHHMRQAVAEFATKLLRERWADSTETGS